jgi:hypothetical protein
MTQEEERMRRRLAKLDAERATNGATALRGMAIVIKAATLSPHKREEILDVAVPKVRAAASAKYAATQEKELIEREAKRRGIKLD